jgi:DNA-binding PadR family transcriptional regulator
MTPKLPSDREYELLVLLFAERTGRDLSRLYLKETGRRISYGTLYTTLGRLKDAGFVRVTREAEDADGRLRYFRITSQGATAAAAKREKYRDMASLGSRLRPEGF